MKTYTQPPHLSDDEIWPFVQTVKVARFCSMNADGTIHAVPVWFLCEGGRILVASPVASRRVRNVARDPKVTLLIDDSGTSASGPKGVIVYGTAHVADADVGLDEAARLLERYFPPERARSYARGVLSLTRWRTIEVEPQRMASFDYAKDDAYRGATGG